MPRWRLSQYIETKLQITYFYLIWSFYIKKRGLGLVFLYHTLHDIWRKVFLLLYSINWPNFIVWFHLLCDILGNMCIAIVCWPGCDVISFEINQSFLIRLFFLYDQNIKTKIYMSQEEKELLKWNKKYVSSFFLKGFYWSK